MICVFAPRKPRTEDTFFRTVPFCSALADIKFNLFAAFPKALCESAAAAAHRTVLALRRSLTGGYAFGFGGMQVGVRGVLYSL